LTPSESVSVPFVTVKTLMLFRTLGPGEKLNDREVPVADAK
jgi:hypothetical protein